MLLGYCEFRRHRISYITEFLKQIQLRVKLQNSATEICATHIEEVKVILRVFYQCAWDEGGMRNIKRHSVNNRNSKAWHLPDLQHYLQLPLLSLNYQLGKVWVSQLVLRQ